MKASVIDTSTVWMRNKLIAAQIECLPSDTPIDPTEHRWWGLYVGTELAGFASLDPETGYLSRAGVLPAFRGRGGQLKLIKAREKAARALGLPLLTSDTYNNPASANNLIACGFRMYQPSFPVDGVCYWRKPLQ